MADPKPKVSCSFDLLAEGKQQGYLNVPHSSNESAWGAIRVPIATICRGEGPTLLFTGGNHGDEYEGPIALAKLIRSLEPESVQGRVIVIPYLNFSGVEAGTRCSPIDGLNMNRVFPGNRDGSVTEMIAHYLSSQIVPLADAVFDIHSGGKTLNFLPSVLMHEQADSAANARTRAALLSFGAPYGVILRELDAGGMLSGTVESMGKLFLATELGGGGTATTTTVAIAERGIANLLRYFGVTGDNEPDRDQETSAPTRLLEAPDGENFLVSDDMGIYEPLVDLGATVRTGDGICQIHSINRPWQDPVVYKAKRDGLLVSRHHPGLVRSGDCMAVIASDAE